MTNEQYYDLIKPYEDARRVMNTRLEVLNHSLYKEKTFPAPSIISRAGSRKKGVLRISSGVLDLRTASSMPGMNFRTLQAYV